MASPLRVLILDQNSCDAELTVRELTRAGFQLEWERLDTEQAYLAALESPWDLILADFNLPQLTGLHALHLLKEQGRDIPFIFVTRSVGDEVAAHCVKQGAADYVLKDRRARLGPSVKQALEQHHLREERRVAEQALRENERRFRLLAENARDLVYRFRVLPQMCVEYVSPSVTAILGYTPEEYYADPDLVLRTVHTEDQPALKAVWGGRDPSPVPVVLRYRRKDGEMVWLENLTSASRDEAGRIVVVEGVARDVSERVRTQEQIKRLNGELDLRVKQRTAELRAILSAMTEGLMVVDSGQKIVYFNRAAADILDVPEAQALGLTFDAFRAACPSEFDLTPANAVALKAVLGGEARGCVSFEVSIRRQPPREVSVTAFPVLGAPAERLTGVLVRDVTEERDLSKRKDTLMSVASHELRNPMATVMGHAELLLERDPPQPTRRKWVQYIYDETRRLTNILEDLLNVSQIHSGGAKLRIEAVSPQEVVREVLPGIRSMTENHLFFTAIPDGVPNVAADRAKLVQVLVNLLSNAVKYSPAGGPVTVGAAHDPSSGRVVFSVSDRGLGIAPEDQRNLFASFQRVRRPETENIRGTGLGLYIVKELVGLMSGEVWLESQLDQGSTFYCALPCANGKGPRHLVGAGARNGASQSAACRLSADTVKR